MLTQLLAFLPVITLLCVVPGANNLLVVRTATEHGALAAGTIALGASVGILTWSTAAAVGVGGLLAAVPGGLRTVAIAGSLAMVAMGLWSLLARPRRTATRGRRGFGTGLAVCLANPRTPLMAVSLLPQYAVAQAALTSTVALGVVWATVALAFNAGWVTLARRRLAGRTRAVQRGGGAVVVGLGVLGLAQAV